jgi:hypothetical protein
LTMTALLLLFLPESLGNLLLLFVFLFSLLP